MAKPFKNKKIPKYPLGGDTTMGLFGQKAKDFGLYAADNALTTAVPGGLGSNIIKQDQYDNTGLGRELGKNQAYKESFDAMSPLSKMARKTGVLKNDQTSMGNSDAQQAAYDQAAPFAQMGSKIGEMWAGNAFGSMGNGAGQMLQKGVQQGDVQAPAMGQVSQSGQTQAYPSNVGNWGQTEVNPVDQRDMRFQQYKGQGDFVEDFAFGGLKFPGGGYIPNAEVEKQENSIAPNGEFTQYSGPSHEQGGIPTNLEAGEKIFSDRLKLGKKTFAALNKVNNTNKEDKILEDSKASKTSKLSAMLMKGAKSWASDKLFEAQEELKQTKVLNYAKKMGLALGNTEHKNGGYKLYPDGGVIPPVYNQGRIPDTNGTGVDAFGMPIDKFGRRLTASEQLGFNRNMTQGNTFTNTGGGRNSPGVGIMGLGNVGGVNTGVNVYGSPLTTQPQYVQQPTNMTDAQFIAQNTPKYPDGGEFDWKGALFNAGMTGANSMGQLAYLANEGKKYDKQDFYEYNPQTLDRSADAKDLATSYRNLKYNIGNMSGGNAGGALTNLQAAKAQNSIDANRMNINYSNQDAGILNDAKVRNITNRYMVDDVNARNKGAALTAYYKTLNSTGTNIAQGAKDYKGDQMDNMSLELMKDMFSNYSYDKSSNSWKYKK